MKEGEDVREGTDRDVRVEGVGVGATRVTGRWREGSHDDLVLAVELACWRARWKEVGHVGRPLGVE